VPDSGKMTKWQESLLKISILSTQKIKYFLAPVLVPQLSTLPPLCDQIDWCLFLEFHVDDCEVDFLAQARQMVDIACIFIIKTTW
jgi:hypothetical protein